MVKRHQAIERERQRCDESVTLTGARKLPTDVYCLQRLRYPCERNARYHRIQQWRRLLLALRQFLCNRMARRGHPRSYRGDTERRFHRQRCACLFGKWSFRRCECSSLHHLGTAPRDYREFLRHRVRLHHHQVDDHARELHVDCEGYLWESRQVDKHPIHRKVRVRPSAPSKKVAALVL